MEAITRKPHKASITQFLVEKTANDLQIDEDIVNHVVLSQYKRLKKAVWEEEMIEISGFGTILLSQYKLKRKLINLDKGILRLMDELNRETDPEKRAKKEEKLIGTEQLREFVVSKIRDEN